ncbi:glutaredoxin family protein [Thiosocius teredinicola]|uniref:glutaredoxin family protein n=1 Tax=Thiosocius teredinicola TaxID=1973002 RepID=UPI0013DDED85
MKKLLFVVLVLASIQHWQKIVGFFDSPAQVAGDHEVILYGTAWCGYCNQARRLFADHGVSYLDVDIEKSSEGKAQFDRLGGRGVPLIVVGDRKIRGFDKRALLAELGIAQ